LPLLIQLKWQKLIFKHVYIYIHIYINIWPASWSSGQLFWLLIMRSGVDSRLYHGDFSPIGKDPHGGHGLGS
jgi:hypothetical protein